MTTQSAESGPTPATTHVDIGEPDALLTFNYCFSDSELQNILGVIEQQAQHGGDGGLDHADLLNFFDSDAGGVTVPLQFQPKSSEDPATAAQAATAAAGSAAIKVEAAAEQPAAVYSAFSSPFQSSTPIAPETNLPAPPAMALAQQPPSLAGGHLPPFMPPNTMGMAPVPCGSSAPGVMVGVANHMTNTLGGLALSSPSMHPQQQLLCSQPGMQGALSAPLSAMGMSGCPQLPGIAAAAGASQLQRYSSSCGKGGIVADQGKGQISHSTVEKQRRDRINSLIDELRELVPPQKPLAGLRPGQPPLSSEALEARRPKHVVLADTIALLKQLQTTKQTVNGEPMSNGARDDAVPANSEGASKGSASSQDDMDVAAAPQMPYIPCQLTQTSGVTVERGPDCLYVQVKCRDRKGLLSDIINSLKLLPLEIRTAAVTTTSDGTVRDVFEVKLEDGSLTPEDIQNMVHDALFQQHIVPYESVAGKRQRQQLV